MTDTQRFFLSGAAGIVVFAAITALYHLEQREPNKAFVGATAAVAAVGAWHFLSRKRKS
jgi:hypothetical protein